MLHFLIKGLNCLLLKAAGTQTLRLFLIPYCLRKMSPFYRTCLSLFFLLHGAFLSASAQQNQLDSMIMLIENTSNDSIKALTLSKVGFQYIFKDTELARQYIQKAYALSKASGNQYGLVYAISTKGIFYNVNGISDSALIHFEQALELSRQHHFADLEIKQFNNLGMYHWNLGMKTEALEFFHRCLEMNTRLPDHQKMDESTIQNNLGLIYQEMGFYEKALGFHQKALAIRRANPGLQNVVPHSLNNIGICYRSLQRYTESEKAYREAIALNKTLDNQSQYYACMGNLANLYAEQNRHSESLQLNLEILGAPKTVKLSNKFVMNANAMVAGNYLHLKKPGKALEYAQIALTFVEQEPELEFFASPAYRNASLGYYLLGNTTKGMEYQQKYEKLIEKKFIEDHAGKLAELETKYNTAVKENEILTLKQQHEAAELKIARVELEKNRKNKLLFGSFLFTILLMAGSVAWYRWKQFNVQLKSEQALQNAMFMSEQNERVRIARDLHDSIGQKLLVQKMMLHKLMEQEAFQHESDLLKTTELTNETIREVRSISHNLIPAELNLGLLKAIEDTVERIRLTGRLEVEFKHINIQLNNKELPANKQLTVYRIFQEILNNLLKHAGATRMVIELNRFRQGLQVSINDNGRGFDTRQLSSNDGLGWKNILARVKFLNGELNIQSQPHKGTFVKLNIPFEQ